MWPALIFFSFLIFINRCDGAFCGRSGVPFSLEILPSGAPVLGCAQPSCVATVEDSKADSKFIVNADGQPDGFLRSDDKSLRIKNLNSRKLIANCSGKFAELSCPRKDQWVGGIEYIDHPRQPLILQCCSFSGLRFSQEVGVSNVGPGETITGGEVVRDGRQISFDVIANVRKVFDINTHQVSYEVTIRRMSCLPDPPEPEIEYDPEAPREILKILSKANGGVESTIQGKHSEAQPKLPKESDRAFAAPIKEVQKPQKILKEEHQELFVENEKRRLPDNSEAKIESELVQWGRGFEALPSSSVSNAKQGEKLEAAIYIQKHAGRTKLESDQDAEKPKQLATLSNADSAVELKEQPSPIRSEQILRGQEISESLSQQPTYSTNIQQPQQKISPDLEQRGINQNAFEFSRPQFQYGTPLQNGYEGGGTPQQFQSQNGQYQGAFSYQNGPYPQRFPSQQAPQVGYNQGPYNCDCQQYPSCLDCSRSFGAPPLGLITLPPASPHTFPSLSPIIFPSIPPHTFPSLPPHTFPTLPPHTFPTLPPHTFPTLPPHTFPTFPPITFATLPPHTFPTLPPIPAFSVPSIPIGPCPTGPSCQPYNAAGSSYANAEYSPAAAFGTRVHQPENELAVSAPVINEGSLEAGRIQLPYSPINTSTYTLPTLSPLPPHTFPSLPPHTFPTLPPHTFPTLPPHTFPTLPPHTFPSLSPHTYPGLPPHTFPTLPPHTFPTLPPHTFPTLPPHTFPTLPPHSFPPLFPAAAAAPPASPISYEAGAPGGALAPGAPSSLFLPPLPAVTDVMKMLGLYPADPASSPAQSQDFQIAYPKPANISSNQVN